MNDYQKVLDALDKCKGASHYIKNNDAYIQGSGGVPGPDIAINNPNVFGDRFEVRRGYGIARYGSGIYGVTGNPCEESMRLLAGLCIHNCNNEEYISNIFIADTNHKM